MKLNKKGQEQLKKEVRQYMMDYNISDIEENTLYNYIEDYIDLLDWTYETPCSNCDNLRCSKESKKYDIIRNKIFYCPDQR